MYLILIDRRDRKEARARKQEDVGEVSPRLGWAVQPEVQDKA